MSRNQNIERTPLDWMEALKCSEEELAEMEMAFHSPENAFTYYRLLLQYDRTNHAILYDPRTDQFEAWVQSGTIRLPHPHLLVNENWAMGEVREDDWQDDKVVADCVRTLPMPDIWELELVDYI